MLSEPVFPTFPHISRSLFIEKFTLKKNELKKKNKMLSCSIRISDKNWLKFSASNCLLIQLIYIRLINFNTRFGWLLGSLFTNVQKFPIYIRIMIGKKFYRITIHIFYLIQHWLQSQMLVRVYVRYDCVRGAHCARREPICLTGEYVVYVLFVDFQAFLAYLQLFFMFVQLIVVYSLISTSFNTNCSIEK